MALVRLERRTRPPRAKPGVDAGAHCIAPCAGGRGELAGKPQGCPWVPDGGGTKEVRPKADLTPFQRIDQRADHRTGAVAGIAGRLRARLYFRLIGAWRWSGSWFKRTLHARNGQTFGAGDLKNEAAIVRTIIENAINPVRPICFPTPTNV